MYLKNTSLCFIAIFLFNYYESRSQKKAFVKYTDQQVIIDGNGDDLAWDNIESNSSFWQWRPTDSIQAEKQTEFKAIMDDENLYFLVKAYTNSDDFLIPSLKRDFSYNTDYIVLLFDTFNDATNAFSFASNPAGVKAEALISGGNTNPRNDRNYSWDAIWDVESSIYEKYLITEFKIPFKSLFFENQSKKWRFNIYRRNTEGNEHSTWIKTPQNLFTGNLGFMGDLDFEKPLNSSKKPISIIPYFNGLVSKNNEENTSLKSLFFGGDIKIPIGNSLNFDITFNPDFSQVEVDDEIVNLTRFEISLPEKRQFFTENSDLFNDFGNERDALPFFSRRIGVSKDIKGNSIENKIVYGARLSGKINKNLRIGFLNMMTEADEKNEIASNYNSVFTLRQKVFNRSNVSFFIIDRRTTKEFSFIDNGEKSNSVYGLEYNLASKDSKWTGRTFFHKSLTSSNKEDASRGFLLKRDTRNHSLSIYNIFVGKSFKSDLGFYRRSGFVKNLFYYTYRHFPKNPKVINYEIQQFFALIYTPTKNNLITDRIYDFKAEVRYTNQTNLELEIKNYYQFLEDEFDPIKSENSVPLPAEVVYNYTDFILSHRSDGRKLFNFNSEVSYGSFYNGNKFSINNTLKWRKQPYVSLSLKLNYNNIILPKPYSSGELWLISPKFEFTFTKKLFWTSFVQFNSQNDNLGINSRLQWRFAPLSDLFIVYNDNYFTSDNLIPRFRSFNIKLTYWLNI
jgi:hypothetical protein